MEFKLKIKYNIIIIIISLQKYCFMFTVIAVNLFPNLVQVRVGRALRRKWRIAEILARRRAHR